MVLKRSKEYQSPNSKNSQRAYEMTQKKIKLRIKCIFYERAKKIILNISLVKYIIMEQKKKFN